MISSFFFCWLWGLRIAPRLKLHACFLSKPPHFPSPWRPWKESPQPWAEAPTIHLTVAHRARESHSGVNTLYDNSMNKMNKMAAVMTQVRWLLHSTSCGVLMLRGEDLPKQVNLREIFKAATFWAGTAQTEVSQLYAFSAEPHPAVMSCTERILCCNKVRSCGKLPVKGTMLSFWQLAALRTNVLIFVWRYARGCTCTSLLKASC